MTPRTTRSATAARVRSPGESEPAARSTSSAPRPYLASSVRAPRRADVRRAAERVQQRLRAGEAAPRLVELAEHDARPDVARSRGQRHLAEQRVEDRRLAAPFGPVESDALAPVEPEVERAEPEAPALDDRALEPRDDRRPLRLADRERMWSSHGSYGFSTRSRRARASSRSAFFTSFDFFFLRPWP